MSKPLASLSLDLDNKWSYLRSHGYESWRSYPSYLNRVVPRVLEVFAQRGLRATVFVVGRDAADERHEDSLRAFVEAGCEIGNHSFSHEPWLHCYSPEQLVEEIAAAEEAIEQATGTRPVGFRGPGFSITDEALAVLAERGYWYDATRFPTLVGPLARLYHRMTSKQLDPQEQARRKQFFGSVRDGFRTLRPHVCRTTSGPLVEIPITTMPLARVPIHMTYLHFLAQRSPAAARGYWSTALRFCRLGGVAPTLLLHPLDFLTAEDEPELAFFPGMQLRREVKLQLVEQVFDSVAEGWQMVTLQERAAVLRPADATLARSIPAPAPEQPVATP